MWCLFDLIFYAHAQLLIGMLPGKRVERAHAMDGALVCETSNLETATCRVIGGSK